MVFSGFPSPIRLTLYDTAITQKGLVFATMVPRATLAAVGSRLRTRRPVDGEAIQMPNPMRHTLEGLLEAAGVRVGGGRPWDIEVADPRWYARVLAGGSLALGESYMDGWWESPSLDRLFHRVMRARLDERLPKSPREVAAVCMALVLNLQNIRRSTRVAHTHYDLGNDLFAAMLDGRLNYSCAYWDGCQDLEAAQEAKLELICRKLGLMPGMRLLDIGCGWGGLARYAARRHGVEVVGVTISQKQAALAAQRCQGLPVDVRLEDYRHTTGRFDRVVSVGMFEHVGLKNYRRFMQAAANRLNGDGLFLLHTIGSDVSSVACDPWIAKYVFPGGMLPSPAQITKAMEGLFVLEDWHGFGADYDRTLMAWHRRFSQAWPELVGKYGERFGRMWRYYLLSCAGAFRARRIQLWQIVLSPQGVPGGYQSIR